MAILLLLKVSTGTLPIGSIISERLKRLYQQSLMVSLMMNDTTIEASMFIMLQMLRILKKVMQLNFALVKLENHGVWKFRCSLK
ncbi:hypothetical protein B5G43_05620 [Flavonifractor sp. An92]|nr:hypothetical protein B5G43_05620 [Flavonifractor sp. An92]